MEKNKFITRPLVFNSHSAPVVTYGRFDKNQYQLIFIALYCITHAEATNTEPMLELQTVKIEPNKELIFRYMIYNYYFTHRVQDKVTDYDQINCGLITEDGKHVRGHSLPEVNQEVLNLHVRKN